MSENNINLIFAVTNPVVPLYQVGELLHHKFRTIVFFCPENSGWSSDETVLLWLSRQFNVKSLVWEKSLLIYRPVVLEHLVSTWIKVNLQGICDLWKLSNLPNQLEQSELPLIISQRCPVCKTLVTKTEFDTNMHGFCGYKPLIYSGVFFFVCLFVFSTQLCFLDLAGTAWDLLQIYFKAHLNMHLQWQNGDMGFALWPHLKASKKSPFCAFLIFSATC